MPSEEDLAGEEVGTLMVALSTYATGANTAQYPTVDGTLDDPMSREVSAVVVGPLSSKRYLVSRCGQRWNNSKIQPQSQEAAGLLALLIGSSRTPKELHLTFQQYLSTGEMPDEQVTVPVAAQPSKTPNSASPAPVGASGSPSSQAGPSPRYHPNARARLASSPCSELTGWPQLL